MSEDLKQFARPIGEHVSLGRTLRGVIFVVPIAVIALIFYPFDIYSLEINGVVSRPLGIIIVAAFLWFVVV
ncbi:MAG: hypothetical protein IPL59_18385 [Candidatus Competibacteraceae bacterium]|nr:hypothetical protein [Candidatus Competibacteraceae bacterium]